MKKAAEEAKQQYLKDHPEVQDIDLKYDPLKLIENCKSTVRKWKSTVRKL